MSHSSSGNLTVHRVWATPAAYALICKLNFFLIWEFVFFFFSLSMLGMGGGGGGGGIFCSFRFSILQRVFILIKNNLLLHYIIFPKYFIKSITKKSEVNATLYTRESILHTMWTRVTNARRRGSAEHLNTTTTMMVPKPIRDDDAGEEENETWTTHLLGVVHFTLKLRTEPRAVGDHRVVRHQFFWSSLQHTQKNPSRLGQHPQQTTQFLSPRPFIRKKRLLLSTNCWMRKAQNASISDVLLFHSATAGRQAVWHQWCVHILDAPRGFLLGCKSRWKLPKKNPKHAGTQIK